MPQPAAGTRPLFVRQLAVHLQKPLYRNGYVLIFSTVASSVLGIVYWVLATRFYATSVVGLNSAALSAALFLSGVSQLNLGSVLIRFLPQAAKSTTSLVISTYLISVVLAGVCALLFILGLNIWSPALGYLRQSNMLTASFIISVMALSVFLLQDSVLTGLRQAVWVPIENVSFAVVKIVLLVLLAGFWPQQGIFASYILPVVPTLLAVNCLIFWRLIPQHVQASGVHTQPLVARELVGYTAGNYLASLFFLVTTTLLPIVVTYKAGASANAYFFLPWTITMSLQQVAVNMAMSLTVEAARDQARLHQYARHALLQTARLLVPVGTIILLGAPYILHLFGPNYAREGASLLRLLALALIPNMINVLYLGVARVQRRTAIIVKIQGGLCVLVLGMSYVLLQPFGITGIGWAWLASQTIVACGVLLTQLRSFISIRNSRTSSDLD